MHCWWTQIDIDFVLILLCTNRNKMMMTWKICSSQRKVSPFFSLVTEDFECIWFNVNTTKPQNRLHPAKKLHATNPQRSDLQLSLSCPPGCAVFIDVSVSAVYWAVVVYRGQSSSSHRLLGNTGSLLVCCENILEHALIRNVKGCSFRRFVKDAIELCVCQWILTITANLGDEVWISTAGFYKMQSS